MLTSYHVLAIQDAMLVQRISYLRKNSGISQRKFSKLCGLRDTHVGLLERGTYSSMRSDSLERIAKSLEISLDWLILGKGEPPSESEIKLAVYNRLKSLEVSK